MDSQFKSNGLAALIALPICKGQNATPPGGFTNLIQPTLSQNFNFVGEHSQFAPFKPPQTLEDDIPSEEELSTPPTTKGNNAYVNIDSSDEAPRTEKRIFWTQEEDVRMVSLIAICWCLKFLLTILA